MNRSILLDSSPLGYLTKPTNSIQVLPIARWATAHLLAGNYICVPEVIDYELRRELLRAGKTASVARLDSLRTRFAYLPITTPAMLLAAELLARSRKAGQPTGDPLKLDIDVILASQALTLSFPNSQVIVATENVSHLSRFVNCDLWSNIVP